MIGSRHTRRFGWSGLLAFIVACAFATNGQGANTGDTSVPVEVPPNVYITTCGSLSFGSIYRDGMTYMTPNCTITFGSTNATSDTSLRAADESDTWGMRIGFAGATIPDGAVPGGVALNGGFAMCQDSASVTTPSLLNGCVHGSSSWYSLAQTTSRHIASQSTGTTGSVTVRFGVRADGSVVPGAYNGTVTFTAVVP